MKATTNILKKLISLLLIICMIVSLAGCTPGEADPTEPIPIETIQPPDEATIAPTDSTEPTTAPTDETQMPTAPMEAETEPATEPPQTAPTFATELPTESKAAIFTDVNEPVYATTVNIRTGPSTG